MELPKSTLYSKQGKASSHLHPNLYKKPKQRPQPKPSEPVDVAEIGSMIQVLEKQRLIEETNFSNKPVRPTSSFTAVSRDQHDFAFRNRTGAPKVGYYNPKYTTILPTRGKIPRIIKSSPSPRSKMIFLPSCLDEELNCSFPKSSTHKESQKIMIKTCSTFQKYDDRLNRTVSFIRDFDEKLLEKEEKEGNEVPIPEKFQKKSRAPLELDKQKPRDEFVKETDPPHALRFDFDNADTPNHTRTRRTRTVSFHKMLGRSEFFEDKINLGFYDKEELTLKPKLVLEFNKLLPRKPNVLEHTLENPQPIELKDFERAHFKLSNVRGPFRIPRMGSTTERDDLMYRTLEGYMLNVPDRQSAMTSPRNTTTSFRYYKCKV